MKKNLTLKRKKASSKHISIRLDTGLREEAAIFARENNTTLTSIITEGIKLVVR